MLDFLKKIDHTTKTRLLLVNNQKRYKNYFGGILTIFNLGSIIILSIYLLYSMIFREDLITIYNEEIINKPKFNLKNIPIFFQVYDELGNPIENAENIFKISVFYSKKETALLNGKIYKNINESYLDLKNCSEIVKTFNLYKSIIDDVYYKDKLCINPSQNLKLDGNAYSNDFDNVEYVKIIVEKCSNSTQKNNCISDENINKILNKPIFTIQFLDYKINNKDIENPINSYIKEDIILFSTQISKIVTLFFKNVEFISDNGLIFKDLDKKEINTFFEVKSDVLLIDNNKDCLLKIILTLAKTKSIYFRSCQKILTFLANISGISNTIALLIRFLDNLIIKSLYLNYIANHLNVFEFSDLGKEMDKRKLIISNNLNKQLLKKPNLLLIKPKNFNINPKSKDNRKIVNSPTSKKVYSNDNSFQNISKTNFDQHINSKKIYQIKDNIKLSNVVNSSYMNETNIKKETVINKEEKKKFSIIKNPQNENLDNNSYSHNKIKLFETENNINIINENHVNNLVKGETEINCVNNLNNYYNNFNMKLNLNNLYEKKNDSSENTLKRTKQRKFNNRKLFIPKFIDILCINNFKYTKVKKTIKTSEEYIKRKISVETIIKKIIEFDKLRFFLFDKEVIKAMNSISGPNIFKAINTDNSNINPYSNVNHFNIDNSKAISNFKINLSLKCKPQEEKSYYQLWKDYEFYY